MRARSIAIWVALATVVGGSIWYALSSNTARQQTPDEIDLRLDSFAINLYPPTLSEINSRTIDTLLNAPLVHMTHDGGVRPGIASHWKHDGKVWQFTIEKGRKFSNGQVIRPADVVASICRSMQPSSAWGWALSSIVAEKDAAGLKCTGISQAGQVITIVQKYDAPWLIEALSGPAGWIIPGNANKGGQYGAVPGAGRYQLAKVVPDSYILLTPVSKTSDLPPVKFLYVPDDVEAASLFKAGKLALLYLQSPLLKKLVDAGDRDVSYRVVSHRFDRVRVLILNEMRLAADGLSPTEIATFRDALDASIPRKKLATISDGIAEADAHVLPIFGTLSRAAPPIELVNKLPTTRLTILTEPDAFSDQLAAALPKQIGRIKLSYRTLEKGLLISSIVKKDFDIACVVIEATMHSPKFWTAFFDPKGAFVAFGKSIPGVEKLDLSSGGSLVPLQQALATEGNWITLLREKRIDAIQPWLKSVRYSSSGQLDLSDITIKASTRP